MREVDDARADGVERRDGEVAFRRDEDERCDEATALPRLLFEEATAFGASSVAYAAGTIRTSPSDTFWIDFVFASAIEEAVVR